MQMASKLAWLAIPLVLVVAGSGCGGPPRPDVLLITVDTLRADQIGAYAGGESVTPNLDRLAAEGTLFERASAVMPLTRPSHASILTSLYPREHGVLNNSIALPGDRSTLPELLREQGYRTAAFVAVRLLGRGSGMARGFERYESPLENHRSGDDVVSEALAWLAQLGPDERFFLWMHLFEPHLPYAPPGAQRSGVEPSLALEYPELSWRILEEIAADGNGHIPLEILEHARALYRGEVATVDLQLGRLIAGLGEMRDLDDVLLVFTADHGECFEKGVYFEHADCLYEGAIRVPLIVRHPSVFQAGRRIGTAASGVDVAPTVLRALDLEIPAAYSGRPLQTLGDAEERYVLVEHPFYHQEARHGRGARHEWLRSVGGDPLTPALFDVEKLGIVGRSWKYLRTGEREELYALAPAVDETRNLAVTRSEVCAELRAKLDAELADRPLALVDPGSINDELMETLRALGYVE